MIMSIEQIQIPEIEANRVQNSMVLKKHQRKDKFGNYKFDDGGIFSPKIFGKIGSCTCKKRTKPGYCPDCECRVISPKQIPIFYYKFAFDVPNYELTISFEVDKKTETTIENLYRYNGFMYFDEDLNDYEYFQYQIDYDYSKFDESKILYGKEALMTCFGISEEEYLSNVHRKIAIPHTSYRPITVSNGKNIIGSINNLYLDIIHQDEIYRDHVNKMCGLESIFAVLDSKQIVSEKISDLTHELYVFLCKTKRNVVTAELNGQPITGTIRAVMTNNFSLDEDSILIGYHFISTLYPKLYRDHTIGDKTDIDTINKILENDGYLVLFNRQPTIGAKSIIAMKPQFSKLEAEKYVIQANPIVYDGLAGDVDGDTLNVIALYTKAACSEARKLLPSKNYIEGSNSSIRNGLPEDFVYVNKLLNEKE